MILIAHLVVLAVESNHAVNGGLHITMITSPFNRTSIRSIVSQTFHPSTRAAEPPLDETEFSWSTPRRRTGGEAQRLRDVGSAS